MGVEVVPTPKAPKSWSLAIRFIAKVLSTAHAPIWSQPPRAQNAGYGEQPLVKHSPSKLNLLRHEHEGCARSGVSRTSEACVLDL